MQNAHPKRKTVLALMAHPDDAEFLCAGTLVKLADRGWEVHIATLTPGDCGSVRENSWQISARRTGEATRAASLLGGCYHCLDERDGLVVFDKQTIQKSVELFRRIAPMLVFTHAQRDYMIDHEVASQLARAASFLYAVPNISPNPVIPGSGIPHLYCCDPVDGIDHSGSVVRPTTLVDISKEFARKVEMLSCHESQREWLRAHHGYDEYIEAMKRLATMRGKELGAAAAEAFVQYRSHAYPHDDMLAELK